MTGIVRIRAMEAHLKSLLLSIIRQLVWLIVAVRQPFEKGLRIKSKFFTHLSR
jgi:hypothetical protein